MGKNAPVPETSASQISWQANPIALESVLDDAGLWEQLTARSLAAAPAATARSQRSVSAASPPQKAQRRPEPRPAALDVSLTESAWHRALDGAAPGSLEATQDWLVPESTPGSRPTAPLTDSTWSAELPADLFQLAAMEMPML
ncbi:hypothetical protein QBZ16_000087 [Prototheca wickerhamii]|uniref:Uncharacterized protein n=1 Tax=Prototheca wickerhamii TaxID=3111 RepID=A0AAD9MII6_PROWI|nr:hypothetical protein QBZ16_000087 [Prototheca wickerhamii]